jgi:hypothetical protein
MLMLKSILLVQVGCSEVWDTISGTCTRKVTGAKMMAFEVIPHFDIVVYFHLQPITSYPEIPAHPTLNTPCHARNTIESGPM